MSQNDNLMKALVAGTVLTPFNALELAGTLRLSERIRELIKEGVPIEKKWYKPDAKTRVMSYKLGGIPHG